MWGAAGKFLCNCVGVCGKRRVDVRCVVVDHLQVVGSDSCGSECIRMDSKKLCKQFQV